VSPRSVDLGQEPVALMHLRGPAFARVVTVAADQPWLDVECEGTEVRVSVKEDAVAPTPATLTITGPTGTTVVPVAPPPPALRGQEGSAQDADPGARPALVKDTRPATEEGAGQVADDQETGPDNRQPPVVVPVPPPPPPWWKRPVAAAVAVAMVVGVVVGVVAWRSRGGSDDGGSGDSNALPVGEPIPDDALVWSRRIGGVDQLGLGFQGQGATVPALLEGSWPTVTEDRRTLVYLTGGEDRAEVWAAGTGGQNPRRVISDPECPHAGRPSIDPAGQRIAISCSDATGTKIGGSASTAWMASSRRWSTGRPSPSTRRGRTMARSSSTRAG
jgi:hypothetical protein